MPSPNLAVARQFIDAFEREDHAAVLGLLHPDLVVHEAESLPYPGDHRGLDGFAELLKTLLRNYELKFVSATLHDAGEAVVCEMTIRLTGRATGKTLEMPMLELYRFTDRRISDIDVYYKDTKAVADLLA
jgi:ketosteroid isomerase-like protein